jgi:two-component system, NarL family, response regulator LiaR
MNSTRQQPSSVAAGPRQDPGTATIRVVLADDHQMVCDAVGDYLDEQHDIEVVTSVQDGQALLSAYRQHLPDVVVVDFEFADAPGARDINGAAVITRLQELHENIRDARTNAGQDPPPTLRLLTLSGYGNPAVVDAAVKAGTDGFVRKSVQLSEIADAVRRLAAGEQYYCRATAQMLAASTDTATRVRITAREQQVLELLADGMTNKMIANELVISPTTARDHVDKIMAKLEVASRTQAVSRAWELGLLGVERYQPRPGR